MKVILTTNIKKLGKIGDLVNVKDGFAPTQHYKGIIGNGHVDAIQQINSTITGNAYDFAYNELFRAPFVTPNPAFDPYGTANFGTFRLKRKKQRKQANT